jgi:hypothetical protein
MLNLATRRAIVFFACFAILVTWTDWKTSQSPIRQNDSHQGTNATPQKSGSATTEDLIFGYPALDVFTAILAIATLILAFIAIRQVIDSRAVQRAHVFPLQPQHQFLTDQNGVIWGLRLWVPWKNSGATPATPVNSFIGITWVQAVQNFQFGVSSPEGFYQPFVLGPGAEIASGTVDITHGPLNDLLIHRSGAQFLWGWARYKDFFDKHTTHVVEFCFRVTVEGQLGPPPFTGRVLFAFDGPHNRYFDE